MKKYILRIGYISTLLMGTNKGYAQQNMTPEQYINMYKNIAVREMKKTGIPASITLAQGLLESGIGNSSLAKEGKNHFGIKCHTDWTGKTMLLDDDAPNECFRVYPSAEASYIDHSMFLTTKPRYSNLFLIPKENYQDWARGLKTAGYATNPQYAEILIGLIEKHKLYELDQEEIPTNIEEIRLAEVEKWKKEQQHDKPIAVSQPKTETDIYIKGTPEFANTPKHPEKEPVFYNNKIKAVRAKAGDTPILLAQKYGVSVEELCEYNDMSPMAYFKDGDPVYLQPKRKKSSEKMHLVLPKQTMWDISQLYGVKLESLYERNLMTLGEEPAVKELIYLNSDAPVKPALISTKPKPVVQVQEKLLATDNSKENDKEAQKKKEDLLAPIESNVTLADIIDQNAHTAGPTSTTVNINTPKIEDVVKEQVSPETPELISAKEKLQEAIEKLEAIEKEIIEPVALSRELEADSSLYPYDPTPFNHAEESVSSPTQQHQDIAEESSKKLAVADNEDKNIIHKVEKGDTLYNLSKRYNVSVSQIVSANNISDLSIKLGQDLIIK